MAALSNPLRKRRRRIVGLCLSITTAVLVLFALTLVAGWAPVLHWECEPHGLLLTSTTVQIPALMLNSPYGGEVWGNVSLPPGFLPYGVTGVGTQDSNGGADWAGFQANVTVYGLQNETVWGPGSNLRCTAQAEAAIDPIGNPSVGIQLLGQGSVTDRGEPTALFPGAPNTIYITNGFGIANSRNISTCNGPAQSVLVSSSYLTLGVGFTSAGRNLTAQLDLPITGSIYHYWFPSNGTWQVENLSEGVNAPGGGWSFSYAGSCS